MHFFLMGEGVTLLPFIIYFIRVDGLHEMFFAVILYNIQYAMHGDNVLGLQDRINHMVLIMPLVLIFIIEGTIVIQSKKITL